MKKKLGLLFFFKSNAFLLLSLSIMHSIAKSKLLLIVFSALICLAPIRHLSAQETMILFDTTYYLPGEWDLNTNLLIASSKGYTSEIHRLVKMGADINTTSLDNATPLIYAVANNKAKTIEAILSYNPDIEVFTSFNETALLIAVKMGSIEIAEQLIRKDAEVDIIDRYGVTPLNYASVYGDFYMADMLLYYGSDPNLKSEDGTSPLMASVWNTYADLSDLLIQNGADVNAGDNEGFTPLLIAAQNNDTLLADLLLKQGADINAINIHGYNALTIAIRNGDRETVEFFLKRVTDKQIINDESINPFMAAREYGRTKMTDLLESFGYERIDNFRVDQVSFSAYYRGLSNDSYLGGSVSFIEPLYNLFFSTGFDFKPGYSRVLVQESETRFYQYFDQRYVIWGGIGKKIKLTESYVMGDLSLRVNLNAGYMFAKVFKGTYIKPDDRFVIMPGLFLNWSKKRFDYWAGYEYMKTGLASNGPHWIKIGTSFRFFFSDKRSPLKVIKWY